jgi:NADH:ubiquinone oxidoreductase subunit 2 (subunit N)
METSLIVGLLVIAAVWSVYLLPVVFGDRREASMSSTEEFDRWSHSIAYVQKQSADDLAASSRKLVHQRRRRTLSVLVLLSVGSLGAAAAFGSLAWLLVGMFFVSLIGLYLTALAQMKQRRNALLKVTHVAERPAEWQEPQVRVIAN